MIKRYINLTIYILILLTIVIIISRHDIIERYVNITKFGEFMDCDETCEDGRELKGCGGLNSGSCEPCQAGTAGKGGECNISCSTGNQYSKAGADECSRCNDGHKPKDDRSGCVRCPVGTAGQDGYCYSCTGIKYSSNSGDTECSTCDMDRHRVNSNNTACEACPEGSDGIGGYCNYVNQIVCGGLHTMFLTKSEKVYGCGLNYFNQINSGDTDPITEPTEITYFSPELGNGEIIDQIACGADYTMFLTKSEKVYGCGGNYARQINSSDTDQITEPTEITDFSPELGYGETITQIACGLIHTMFLTKSGKVYGCGGNSFNQVNSSDTNPITEPTEITDFSPELGYGETIDQIVCGTLHTIFLTSSGNVYGCGLNSNKQINSSNTDPITEPTKITDLPTNEEITQIACGSGYTIFLISGKVYMCGSSYYDSYKDFSRPTEITDFPTNEEIIQIASGDYHIIFLTKSGSVYGFGWNYFNQINSSNTDRITEPTKITDLPTNEEIIQIACGYGHTMFLTNSRKVYGCGYKLTKNKNFIIL